MPSHFAPEMTAKEVADYVVGRAQTQAYDSVYALWQRRLSEGRKQSEVAQRLGRKESWLSRSLKGPGNWTLRTLAELTDALNGTLDFEVRAVEDYPRRTANYHAYADYPRLIIADEPSSAGFGSTAANATVVVVAAMTHV